MTIQQIGFISESFMGAEFVTTRDNGQDIFSALLLLALSGNETGGGHFPYFQKSIENMGSVPHISLPYFQKESAPSISIPDEGGEKEMEKSPVSPLESEFLQGAQVLEDAAVSDEKPDLYTLGTLAFLKKTGGASAGATGRSPLPGEIAPLDSVNPAMTPPPAIARDEVPKQSPISHVIKEGVREGDHLLMQHDPLQLPSAQRVPRTENESPFLHELNKIAGLFREGDHGNNFSMDSDGREDRRWVGGAEMVMSEKKPASINNNNEFRPLYKYIEPEKMMQQLTQRLIHASHIGSHTARIRLQPDELGELSLDISVMDNSVKAVIAVDSYDVKEIIEANLHKLDEELKSHGLKIEEFTVEMRGGGAEERSLSPHGREEMVGRKRDGRMVVDSRVDQEGLNIPVVMDTGLVSIFA